MPAIEWTVGLVSFALVLSGRDDMDTMTPNSRLEERMVMLAAMSKTPISGAFELLPVCNLNCKMCYVRMSASACRSQGGFKPLDFWLGIAEELKQLGCLFILLTGGEPFLYPDFKVLYKKLRDMGFILTLNTNGTLIGPEEAAFLREHMPRRVNVTLYGTCPETYEKVTGSAKAYEQTLAGIRNLLEAGVLVKLNVSLVGDNASEVEEFYRIAGKLGIPLELNAYMYPAFRDQGSTYDLKVRMSPEEAAMADLVSDRCRFTKDLFDNHMKAMKDAYVALIEEEKNPDYKAAEEGAEGELIPCRAGSSSFWVNWRGELAPCVFLEQGKSDLALVSVAEAWKSVNERRERLFLPKGCSVCKLRRFCLICYAGAYYENQARGNENLPKPEYLCAMIREKARLASQLTDSDLEKNTK